MLTRGSTSLTGFVLALLLGLSSSVAAADEAPAETKDSHILWIQATGGLSYVNLVQFQEENFAPTAVNLSGLGTGLGAAVGLRFAFFRVGARFNYALHSDFNVGSIGLDLSLHLPIPVVSPYLRAGIGYGWLGNFTFSGTLTNASAAGLVADVGIGLDIRIKRLSIGAGVDVAFLNFTRQRATDVGAIASIEVTQPGDALGLQVRGMLRLTIHI